MTTTHNQKQPPPTTTPEPFYLTAIDHLVNQAVGRLNDELEAARGNGLAYEVRVGGDGVVRVSRVRESE